MPFIAIIRLIYRFRKLAAAFVAAESVVKFVRAMQKRSAKSTKNKA